MALDRLSLRKIVNEYGYRWYHVTDTSRLAGILAKGLLPDMPGHRTPGLVRKGAVYLSSYNETHGVLTTDCDVEWGDAIVSVNLSDLDFRLLTTDEDALRPASAKTTANSIIAATPQIDTPAMVLKTTLDRGTIAYCGAISSRLIRMEFVPRGRRDVPGAAALRRTLNRSPYYGESEFANVDFEAEYYLAH